MLRCIGAALWVGFLVSTTHAQAGLCRPRRTFLAVTLPGSWEPGERGGIMAELRSALEAQSFDLCLEESGWAESKTPVATLRVELMSDAQVRIEVRDAVTDKYVRRDVDTSRIPQDVRPLALAIAADELTRASWAELLMEDAPEPVMEPPPAVQAVVERQAAQVVQRVAPESVPRLPLWLDLHFAVELYGGGDVHLGGQLQLERWLHERVALRLGLGGRTGLASTGELGEVRARALPGQLDLLISVVGRPEEGLQLVTGVGAQVRWVRYVASSVEGAAARDQSAVAVAGGALIGARWSHGIVRLSLELRLGGVIAGVGANENGVEITSVSGYELGTMAGIGVRL